MSVEIEINVYCDECGDELEALWVHKGLHITPCKNCTEREKSASYDEGRKDGVEAAAGAPL